MEERVIRLIPALRAGGVRISLAESADALSAVDELGVRDRDTFRLSLRSTLVKDSASIPVFEELFPLFFYPNPPAPMVDLSQDLTPEEAQMLAQALRRFNEQRRSMLERLMRGGQLHQEEPD